MKNELELLKLALIDYEKGYEVAVENQTDYGFCRYFKGVHDLDFFVSMEEILPTLYKQRNCTDGSFHYEETGYTFNGNADRVTSLKNAIKELES